MTRSIFFLCSLVGGMICLITTIPVATPVSGIVVSESSTSVVQATNVAEARARAQMLHEMANGALQVMHRDFFDDESPRAIPSASLEDVFIEMEKSFEVKLKWLTVNTDIVNVANEAKTDFEKHAIKSLAQGGRYFEEITSDQYQFAGPIRLSSQCLKCHVKIRTNVEDRLAALVIRMPIIASSQESEPK